MPLAEFHDWQMFAAYHPFPTDLIDVHFARLLALIANVNRDAQRTPAFDPSSFRLVRDQDDPPPTPERKGPTIAQRMRAVITGG